jgi:hypothetical protein
MYVKNVSIRKKHYTVLRSPFVHKTSREQFVFEQIKGVIRISFKKANIFFINYLKYLIKFFFTKIGISFFFLTRLIYIR